MKGEKDSKKGWGWAKPIGTAAAILVVAGVMGVPFSVVAAAVLGAAVVIVIDP